VRQVPDAEKRRLADFVVDTGCSMQETEQQVVQLIAELKGKQGTAAARALESATEH
jgi:dephospho-CoA kinase